MVERFRGRWGSVRVKATAGACLVVGLGLLVASWAFLGLLRRSLLHDVDETGRARVEEVAALAARGTLPTPLVLTDQQDDDGGLVQVVDRSGRVVSSSSNLVGRGPISAFHPHGVEVVVRQLRAPAIDRQDEFRLFVTEAQSPSGPLDVFVATNLDYIGSSVRAVRRILAVGAPGLLLFVGITTWLLIGRALRPVESIRSQVATISGHRQQVRVPLPQANDEIARLAVTMNDMLDRLERSSERQRSFVADASHELRTPLTAIRTQLEVALAHPNGRDWSATASEVLDSAKRMESLVRDLLFLARSDDAVLPFRGGEVDLDDLVFQEAARVRRGGRVVVDVSKVEATRIHGDAEQLRRAICNLLDNAERHARSGVALEVHAEGSTACLVVGDDGLGIAPEHRRRIFERFTRLDDARSRDSGGSGLGLAITREIVVAHGGAIASEDPRGGVGARFVARFPIAMGGSRVPPRNASLAPAERRSLR